VRHHLEALEEAGLLVPYRNGRLVCWFPARLVSREDRELISALRVSGQRAVLRALLRSGPARFSELEATSGLPPRSLSRGLRRLTEIGVVEVDDTRRYKVRDHDRVAHQLESIRLRFPDLMADAAREIFDNI
jgi:DNA-binding transcriptional ArsR family regulator